MHERIFKVPANCHGLNIEIEVETEYDEDDRVYAVVAAHVLDDDDLERYVRSHYEATEDTTVGEMDLLFAIDGNPHCGVTLDVVSGAGVVVTYTTDICEDITLAALQVAIDRRAHGELEDAAYQDALVDS